MNNDLLLLGSILCLKLAWGYKPSLAGIQFTVLAGYLLAQIDWREWRNEN
jgi:hypothetical protein